MSEFQYVGFRAVDAPLTDDQLQYMRKQSSRAEITRRSFDNTYHFGDFRGNAVEMLRRGFDVHLHYANFGVRKLMIRFPHGLPALKAWRSDYCDGKNVVWQAESKGPAVVLTMSASTEPGMFEDLWDVHQYLDRILAVRQQLIDGDLRPLYVAWMCGCQADQVDPDSAVEPSVPAGLTESSDSIAAMLDYIDLSSFLLASAAERSGPPTQLTDRNVVMAERLESVDAATLRQWLLKFLTGDPAEIRNECMQLFHESHKIPAWPVTKGTRTFAQLLHRADELMEGERARKKKRQERARQKRLADMVRSPQKYLDEVDAHVAMRSREHYEQAAQTLGDIREAIGGKEGDQISCKHAAHLKKKHPTLKMLIGALRRNGLLS